MIDTDKPYVPPEKYRPKPFNPSKKPEKVKGFTLVSFFVLLGVFLAKYFLDFHLLPALFPDIYPFSALAIVIWAVETILVSVISIKFISGFGYFYIPACLVYAIAVVIAPNGLFGFGDTIPAIVGGLIAYILTRLIQRIVLWIFIGLAFITM